MSANFVYTDFYVHYDRYSYLKGGHFCVADTAGSGLAESHAENIATDDNALYSLAWLRSRDGVFIGTGTTPSEAVADAEVQIENSKGRK